eukprot:COSAG01_NODE_3399_length_6142_cov_11.969236_1_plen_221_part_00
MSAPAANAARFGNLSLQLTFDNVSPMYVGVTAQVPLALLHGVGELNPREADAGEPNHCLNDAPCSPCTRHGATIRQPFGADGWLVRSLASTVRFQGGRVQLHLFFPMPFVQACKLKLYNSGLANVNGVEWSVDWQDAPWPRNDLSLHPAQEEASASPLYFRASHRARAAAELHSDVLLLNVSNMTGHVVGTAITFSTNGTGISSRVLEGDPRFYGSYPLR